MKKILETGKGATKETINKTKEATKREINETSREDSRIRKKPGIFSIINPTIIISKITSTNKGIRTITTQKTKKEVSIIEKTTPKHLKIRTPIRKI